MVICQKTIAAAILLTIIAKRRRNRLLQKRIWSRRWLQRREFENTAINFVHNLRREGTEEFKRYFRMTVEEFDILLEKVTPAIQKRDTQMRKSITPEVRLAICLRYLASGDSFRSLMLLFKVAHNTISGIVSTTCQAIYLALADDYFKAKN